MSTEFKKDTVQTNLQEFVGAVKSCLDFNKKIKANAYDYDLGDHETCRVYVKDCMNVLEQSVPKNVLDSESKEDQLTIIKWATNLFDESEDMRELVLKVYFLELEHPSSMELVNFFENYAYLLNCFQTLKLSLYEYKYGDLNLGEVQLWCT